MRNEAQEAQETAVVIALLLLIGAVLMVEGWLGPWWALGLTAGPVTAAWWIRPALFAETMRARAERE